MARLTEIVVEQATLVKLLFGVPRVKDAAYMIKDQLQTQERKAKWMSKSRTSM